MASRALCEARADERLASRVVKPGISDGCAKPGDVCAASRCCQPSWLQDCCDKDCCDKDCCDNDGTDKAGSDKDCSGKGCCVPLRRAVLGIRAELDCV